MTDTIRSNTAAIRRDIGLRIREARLARGWSQGYLGARLSRPRTHAAISDLERGKVRIPIEELTELADILGVQRASLEEPSPLRRCEAERDSLAGELNAHRRYVEKLEHAVRMLARDKTEIEHYLEQVQEQAGLIEREHPPGPPDPPIVPWRPKEYS